MILHSPIPFFVVSAAFIATELALYILRSRKLKEADKLLRLAKQESFESAQISLNDPYPLVQISDRGDIIFINRSAFEKFPDIQKNGFRHPVLSGLDDIIKQSEPSTREVAYGDIIYHQTIAPTQVNGHTAFTLYCYDITEQKAYEKKLQESREIAELSRREAEKANQARGDFLANMSHELRTPMNGIIGLSDILIEVGLKPEHQIMIETLNSSAHNLLVLLNDILDFSKIEAGELTLESIPFDLPKIVRQIETLQKPIASRKGLLMKSNIDDTVPQCLVGDPTRLQQILNNLVNNSLKFTSDGSITLSVSGNMDEKGHFLTRISVSDTGIGIPKDKFAKVFEKFQQADPSTARKYGGTGLGLPITKYLAEMMGGRISLDSEEGKGTTFTVFIPLPIAEAVENERETPADRKQLSIDTHSRILVVDDHPVNLLLMRQTLTMLGFKNFDEAALGRQAIDLFKKSPYDLIFMDCQMPEMDGFEASRQIRRMETEGHESVIIAVTANAMKGAQEKCMSAGMDDYISKPIDKKKLYALLQRWLPGEKYNAPQPADEAQGSANTPVFDWKRFQEFTQGDKQTETMLIDMFLDNLDQDLARLQANFTHNKFKDWEAAAHKMHGASENMGACALAEACNEAQFLSAENIGKIKGTHDHILRESQRLLASLKHSNHPVSRVTG